MRGARAQDRRWRHAPKQRRSREIVRAIVEAGRELLEREGEAALTTNRIAERAGVSIGSLYRYFPNKEAVVAAIYDREALREVVELREAEPWLPDPQPLRDALTEIVDFQLERHRRLSELGGSFYRDHHREFSLARRLGAEQVERGIRRLLERHADEVRVHDLDEAAFLVARGVSAVVRLALDERPEKLGRPAFRDELVDLLVRYVCRAP